MKTIVLSLVAVTVVLVTSPLAFGEGFEEIVLSATFGETPFFGLQLSWHLDERASLRAGLALGGAMTLEGFSPTLRGRLDWLQQLMPSDPYSVYTGVGIGGIFTFPSYGVRATVFPEVPFGVQFNLNERYAFLGEFQLGLARLQPKTSASSLVNFLGLSGGVCYLYPSPTS